VNHERKRGRGKILKGTKISFGSCEAETGGPDPEPEGPPVDPAPQINLPRPKPFKPIEISITAPPTITHPDPPEIKPIEIKPILKPQPQVNLPRPKPIKPIEISITMPPTVTHPDPPEIKPQTIEYKPMEITITAPPKEKHIDPYHKEPRKATGVGDEIEDPDMGPLSDGGGFNGAGGASMRAGTEASDGFAGAKMSIDSLRNKNDQAAIDAAVAIKNGAATPENCAREKDALEEIYVKTYVELSRLKNEYDELANSTACVDNVESLYHEQKTPLQEAIDDLIKDIDQKVKELQNLRPRLESATIAEKELRKHIAVLTQECSELPETVSNLDKVRDAIEALSKCPGLSRVQFSLPKWTGTYVSLYLKAKEKSDEEQDAILNAACATAVKGTRAAEVAEIAEQTVEGIPETNTADLPLIGTCPDCAGDEALDFPSKHKRICWKQGKSLNHKERSTNCASGKKAVLCVIDRENIRQIPGES